MPPANIISSYGACPEVVDEILQQIRKNISDILNVETDCGIEYSLPQHD